MKVLFFGLGSIGKKHLRVLKEIKPNAQIFAYRSSVNAPKYEGVKNIFHIQSVPKDLDFIIISNPTSLHGETIKKCIFYKVPIFIEKPPISSIYEGETIVNELNENQIKSYVAFNLRFHPVIEWLKQNLSNKNVLEVNVYCGSYLPDWRPGSNYRNSYSAKKELGGGVALDLIHEIDYTLWLFGVPSKKISVKSKVSSLEIETEDYATYILEYPSKVVTIQLNYFRKFPKRSIEIVFENEVWQADLLNSRIVSGEGKEVFKSEIGIENTYYKQMKYFLSKLNTNESYMNSFADSFKTLKVALD